MITAADLFPKSIFVGLPNELMPETEIILSEESEIFFQNDIPVSNAIEWTNIQKLKNLNTATLKKFLIISNNSYINKIRINIVFKKNQNPHRQC